MKERKKYGYYTFEKCFEIVKQYNTVKELLEKDSVAYQKIIRKGWKDEMFKHFVPATQNKSNRWVYVYLFDKTNSFYVGITDDLKRRNNRHLKGKDSIVFKYIKDNNLQETDIEYIVLEEFDYNVVGQKECDYYNYYVSIGMNGLNDTRALGRLGGYSSIWNDYDKCKTEALKYKNRWDFQRNCRGAYNNAKKNEWLDDICSHMEHGLTKWTLESCMVESKKYKNRTEFSKGNKSAYNTSLKNEWLDRLFPKTKKQ